MVEIGSQKRNSDLYAGYFVPGALFVGPRRQSASSLSYESYVQASEVGSVVATGFDLNGGTITSAEAGEAANLVFERTGVVSVDGRDKPASPLTTDSCRLRPSNRPQSGKIYRVGDEIQIAAHCTETLTVTGTP